MEPYQHDLSTDSDGYGAHSTYADGVSGRKRAWGADFPRPLTSTQRLVFTHLTGKGRRKLSTPFIARSARWWCRRKNRPGAPGGVGALPPAATADIFGKFTPAALRAMGPRASASARAVRELEQEPGLEEKPHATDDRTSLARPLVHPGAHQPDVPHHLSRSRQHLHRGSADQQGVRL